ncbi:30S ribosomal protein S17 [Candidatus Woesearchaeota archaeon CG_4_10_14_0_2_um_filter_33_13]|nr:MAG: 30S ribosomal protein S17 [Candidatus Woesearchaeota archaeon CG_4_10_14_0_2_um_filter_33_13]
MKKEIMGIKAPAKECTDQKCPFHGTINVKDELFNGKVVKKDINHSATIEWTHSTYISKYERYEVKKSRMRVHNPACVDAEIGDEVIVARTRPLSKTITHVILTIVNKTQIEEKGSKK